MAMIEREEGQRTTIAAAAALPKNQRLTLAAFRCKLTDTNPCQEPMQIKLQMIICSIACSLVASDERLLLCPSDGRSTAVSYYTDL